MTRQPRRRSDQREAILAAIRSRGGHSTAAEIYEAVKLVKPRVSLGTVYRNLRVLSDQGAIREVKSGASFSTFEIAGPSHYHLICRRCGLIEDCLLPIDRSLEQRVQALTKFRVEQHKLEFIGLCDNCQSLFKEPELTSVEVVL